MKTIKENYHYIYLLLSIIGGGFTFYFVMIGVTQNNGQFNVLEFVKSTWLDNAYAKSITLDFWTGASAGTLFMVFEGMRLKMKRYWLYIVCTFLVGFAFAFPLFLFVRAQFYINKTR